MKIDVKNIDSATRIDFSGDEPWIIEISKSLQQKSGLSPQKVTGFVQLRPDNAGFIYGQGLIQHAPMLACYRCDREIPWELNESFSVSWRPAYENNVARDMALSADDLDVYFIENGSIDIGQLIRDVLHCAIPDSVRAQDEASDNCRICGIDLSAPILI
jgi:uncharacterized metal-binding protein YceD (DUF177 family)